jgi:hypothetical protein
MKLAQAGNSYTDASSGHPSAGRHPHQKRGGQPEQVQALGWVSVFGWFPWLAADGWSSVNDVLRAGKAPDA